MCRAAYRPAPRGVEHPDGDLLRTRNSVADKTAARQQAGRLIDHLMDANHPPSPRMPPIGNLNIAKSCGSVGVLSSSSTTRAVVTPRSGISRLSITSVSTGRRHRSRRTPACRRALGRQGQALRAAPTTGPPLTAAARDSRTVVRVGTKEWLRRGPNQRMVGNRRTRCGQIGYRKPKHSPVHETGAGPVTDEGYDWRCHMVEQSADLRAIVVIIGRQPDRHDLTGVGVYAEMECSPGPTCLRAMLLDQSVAGTAQLQLGAVHHQLHGLVPRSRSRHLQCFGSPAQCRTVRHGKIEAEQGNDITERTT